MGGAGVCGTEFLWIHLAGIVDICVVVELIPHKR